MKILSWHRGDIEERCGFRGGKYTDINLLFSLIGAFLIGGWAILVMILLRGWFPDNRIIQMVLNRGWTPYAMVALFSLALVALFVKRRKLAFQKRAFSVDILPKSEEGFALTSDTAVETLARLKAQVDDPVRFVLLNRVHRALNSLQNVGNLSDVSELLKAQAENDENQVEASYGLIRGIVWMLPILGFIGTVSGLSGAIGGFGKVLGSDATIDSLRDGLTPVTDNLGLAFDTTFLALVLAMIIQMLATLTRRSEDRFLDRCRDWVHENVTARLRLVRKDND